MDAFIPMANDSMVTFSGLLRSVLTPLLALEMHVSLADAPAPDTDLPSVLTVAVVADPACLSAADLLTAALTGRGEIALLERQEMARILTEQQLCALHGSSSCAVYHETAGLLGADVLVVLHADTSRGRKLVTVRVIEARRGLRLCQRSILWDADAPEASVAMLRAAAAFGIARARERTARLVAVPPFQCGDFGLSTAHRKSVYAALVRSVAETVPGVLLVELDESQRVSSELTISGEPGVARDVPHYLLGSYKTRGLGRDRVVDIRLVLRRGREVVSELQAESLDVLAERAFLLTAVRSLLQSGTAREASSTPVMSEEFRLLVEQADTFRRFGDRRSAIPLYEVALLLQPDSTELRTRIVAECISVISKELVASCDEYSNRPQRCNDLAMKRLHYYLVGLEHVAALLQTGAACVEHWGLAERFVSAMAVMGDTFRYVHTDPDIVDRLAEGAQQTYELAKIALAPDHCRDEKQAVIWHFPYLIPRTCLADCLDAKERWSLNLEVVRLLARYENSYGGMAVVAGLPQRTTFYAWPDASALALAAEDGPAYGWFLDQLAGEPDARLRFLGVHMRWENAWVLNRVPAFRAEKQSAFAKLLMTFETRDTSLQQQIRYLKRRLWPAPKREKHIAEPEFLYTGGDTPKLFAIKPLSLCPDPPPSAARPRVSERFTAWIPCGPLVDVVAGAWTISLMRERGIVEHFYALEKEYVRSPVWDGELLWFTALDQQDSSHNHIVSLNLRNGRSLRFDKTDGLPDMDRGCSLAAVRPGVVCAVGGFGPVEGRRWVAVLSNHAECHAAPKQKVDVVMRMTRAFDGLRGDDPQDPEMAFGRSYVLAMPDPDDTGRSAVLVGRRVNGRLVGPLLIRLESRTASVVRAGPVGSSRSCNVRHGVLYGVRHSSDDHGLDRGTVLLEATALDSPVPEPLGEFLLGRNVRHSLGGWSVVQGDRLHHLVSYANRIAGLLSIDLDTLESVFRKPEPDPDGSPSSAVNVKWRLFRSTHYGLIGLSWDGKVAHIDPR